LKTCACRWVRTDQASLAARPHAAVIGDKWTLLLARDVFLGIRRNEFERRWGTRTSLQQIDERVEDGVLTSCILSKRAAYRRVQA